ncbi:hypothetical protein ABW636_08260 [Aquimarina sp. 2201CG1-2-11]
MRTLKLEEVQEVNGGFIGLALVAPLGPLGTAIGIAAGVSVIVGYAGAN